MPTKKQLSQSMESQFEFPQTRREDDPMYKPPTPSAVEGEPDEPGLSEKGMQELYNSLSDILYEVNGNAAGTQRIFYYLKENYILIAKP